jgi:hypothetical protein
VSDKTPSARTRDPDKSRVAGRLASDYLLRSLKMLGELADGDLLTGLVSLAIVQANVSHVDHALGETGAFDGLATIPPDVVRRPVSVLAVADSLGLPYETTRRHVTKLIKSGQVVRTKGGVVAPTSVLKDPRRQAMLDANIPNLRRLFRNLKAASVVLD